MAAAPEQSERITETSCDKPAENPQISTQRALITHRINVQLSLQITYISIFHRIEKLGRMDEDSAANSSVSLSSLLSFPA